MDQTHRHALSGIGVKMQPCARQRQARQPPRRHPGGARGRALANPGPPRRRRADWPPAGLATPSSAPVGAESPSEAR
eukprot:2319880-Pyramimonas_sp.AAC.1